jgi:hypothetical protein
MSAIYHGLLNRDPSCYDEWIDALSNFLAISKDSETWQCIMLFHGSQLNWADKGKVAHFIQQLMVQNSVALSSPSVVMTIWKLIDKLDDSLLIQLIEYWLFENSPALIQAVGELTSGFIISGRSSSAVKALWTREFVKDNMNFKRGVIYSACSGWYELGKIRGDSHDMLMSCLHGELGGLACAMNALFSFDKRMPNDELTYEVISLIADNPSLIEKLDKHSLISCLVKLNPRPKLMDAVLNIAHELVQIQKPNNTESVYIDHAEELVQLAVTLQRTSGTVKEGAMALYEKLLDAGSYRAEEAAASAVRL